MEKPPLAEHRSCGSAQETWKATAKRPWKVSHWHAFGMVRGQSRLNLFMSSTSKSKRQNRVWVEPGPVVTKAIHNLECQGKVA